MKLSSRRRTLFTVAFLFLPACGDSISGPGHVYMVLVDPLVAAIHPGDSVQFTAIPRDNRGNTVAGRPVLWISSDTTTATVSQTGVVTGRALGQVKITAAAEGKQGTATVTVVAVPVASVTLQPASVLLHPGDTLRLFALPKDSSGSILTRPVAWSSSDTTRAAVSSTGLVTTRDTGVVQIAAESEGQADTAAVAITLVASIAIAPSDLTMVPEGVLQFRAAAFDRNGDSLPGYPVAWQSGDKGVATVSATGLVTGQAPGSTTITVTADSAVAQASLHVRTVVFRSIDAGEFITLCGVSTDSLAFCNGSGHELGVGDALLESGMPLLVTDSIRFLVVGAGEAFTCGLAISGAAYCWGYNAQGRLGDGGVADQFSPVAVAGALTFDSLSSGHSTTCALTAGGMAYCWGGNGQGELGVGPGPIHSNVPMTVSGGLTFRSISAGQFVTCGIAADSAAYCWGGNTFGQLGTGDTIRRYTPVAVAGGLKFRSISASYYHVCGVAVDGTGYCWGGNESGELGVGDSLARSLPTPVAGGLSFRVIKAGGNHVEWGFTCGLTTGDAAYCWGNGGAGQLGAPTTSSPTPQPVSGGLTFTAITAGGRHACGIATTGVAYCWGAQYRGADTDVPTRVAGQP